jgi:hypothetical protein
MRQYNLCMNTAERHALLDNTVERIGRMANLTPRECACYIKLVRSAADIEGVEAVFQRMNERDDDEALDHLAEIRYGVLFRDLKFLARFEPMGLKGSDLMVERDQGSAFVEVKRYRPKAVDSIPEALGPGGTYQTYGGNPAYTQAQIEKDLLCKIRQIEPRNGVQHGILAIWSDRSSFENDVFTCAVRRVPPKEAKQNGLRFCIFGTDFVTVGVPKRFYCEVVSLPETPFRRWMEDIQGYLG